MSAEKRERPRVRHQSPPMSELLASCAAADAVSTPPDRRPLAPDARDEPECADPRSAEPRPLPERTVPRRDAA